MDLVAPLIPDAQRNQGPALFLQGLGQGLQAFTRMAEQRRQSESEIARMALQERLATQEHDLQAQRLAQSYELDNRRILNEEALMPARKAELEARADYQTNTRGVIARKATAQIAAMNDFNLRVAKYGLDDPNPKDPVKFYANARRLKDEFSWANIPDIKLAIKDIDMRTKEHTVPLLINQRTTDEAGNVLIQPITKQVPIGEVIENIKDPKKYDQMIDLLRRNGLFPKYIDPNIDPEGEKAETDKVNASPTVKALRAAIQAETKAVESGGGTDFSRGQRRVQPGGLMAEPEATPAPPQDIDESDLFSSIGQTEKYLGFAKAALAKGADPRAVAAKLQGFGVDPAQLWA
jgi:hypothetical protein